ncbi:MAG: HDOD domain-containing protein [Bryobacteraceae bacterium]
MQQSASTIEHANVPAHKIQLASVPAFPPIALRLLDLLGREDVEIKDLIGLIGSDAATAAQVLRMANSPLFGVQAQIDNLQNAVVLLGLDRIQGLAVTIATSSFLRALIKIQELRRCWRHMLACAVLTELYAQTFGIPDGRAYMAGLLHDVGRLGLLVSNPDGYAECLRLADRNAIELVDYESQVFGTNHCELGLQLAVQWNLPEDFRIIAGRHHDPQQGLQVDLLTVVNWACQTADIFGYFVVPPLQPKTLDEFIAGLAPSIQQRFPNDTARMVKMLEDRIQPLESGMPVESGAKSSLRKETSLPAEDEPEPNGKLRDNESPDRMLFASAAPFRLRVEDFALVGITGIIFSLVFLAFLYGSR